MFYSHDILTSPEHGVATIWLVATLGARSITRKLNKKAILDVDVPKACEVIMDPVAPMALRLQGNLLYGVTRVYNQQCGYALTDVQAMHDRMRSMLRSIVGTGLDPTAGKARPEQLILPYDPSFLPESNLPGLGLDLSKLRLQIEEKLSQRSGSGFSWPATPDLTQTFGSEQSSLRLEFSSQDLDMGEVGGFASETDMGNSVKRKTYLDRMAVSLGDEEGILLQPDFEFDEDGNLIELGIAGAGTEIGDRRSARYIPETPVPGERRDDDINGISWNLLQPMLDDEEMEAIAATREHTSAPNAHPITPRGPFDGQFAEETEAPVDNHEAPMRPTRRAPRAIPPDEQTALRNTELAQFNNEYVQNMAATRTQKLKNKLPTQAKKIASFWVIGQGIGSVGVGLGTFHVQHPLHCFAGEALYGALVGTEKSNKRKQSDISGGSGADSKTRRIQRREESEEQMGRGELFHNTMKFHDDVEIARHASSILRDENTSQMPWNITASIQSSRLELSTTSIFHGLGSISGLIIRGIHDSTTSTANLAAANRTRNRMTSASPLAARSLHYDLEGLVIPGTEDDTEALEGFNMNDYFQNELDAEHTITEPKAEEDADSKRRAFYTRLLRTNIDQESLNFLEFLDMQIKTRGQTDNVPGNGIDQASGAGAAEATHFLTGSHEAVFSTLLPPETTSRVVATQGLMHILTLATKGFLMVRQEPYGDQSSKEYGVRYEFGDIYLRFSDM